MYWIHLGLIPTALLGHSLGEYVAATVAELVSPREALALVVGRALLIRDNLVQGEWGMMAMSPKSWTQIREQAQAEGIVVSAINSVNQLVVSGPRSTLKTLQARVSDCILLDIPYGYHSPQMASIVPAFRAHIAKQRFSKPKFEFVSSVTAERLSSMETGGESHQIGRASCRERV